ncbi:hypothetical protein QE394_001095 [Arthrobacter sp. SORGH_AS 212]|uniref:hypothetical protein n=1 Tax=Pseudarthrobacter sp. SORGH_AS 212 TaxID=3041777 RepID=UPI00278798EF|nr:hypothetical protein [Arthrobacter sp. SORGH_AS_0212]
MPVAFTSYGYDTTVDKPYGEAAWADAHPSVGTARYGVRSPLDWKVTAVAGQDRTVSINAGRGFGHGVTDKTVENDTIQLATIASGSRWDLIVARRDWTPTAGMTKFEKVSGGSTAAIPGGRIVGPGNIDDQPLALVQVTAGQTQPTAIIDLRTWSGDGGAIVANHDLVRSFLNSVGTRLQINGADWLRVVGANDTPEWRQLSQNESSAIKPGEAPWRTFTGLISAVGGTDANGYGEFRFGQNGLPTFAGVASVQLTEFHPIEGFMYQATVQDINTTKIRFRARRLDNSGWANGYGSLSMFVTVVGW